LSEKNGWALDICHNELIYEIGINTRVSYIFAGKNLAQQFRVKKIGKFWPKWEWAKYLRLLNQ
jgi:hypothetical protein